MAKRNELTREHESLRCAHEKLKAEQEQWIETAKEAANHKHAGVSQMLSLDVKVCKRCGDWNT